MNRRPTVLLTLLATALMGLAGCKAILKKKIDPAASASVTNTAPPAPVAVAPTTVATPEPAPAPVAVDENAVPTPEDFEDEAAQKVTPSNFKAEFARLKKEIGQ